MMNKRILSRLQLLAFSLPALALAGCGLQLTPDQAMSCPADQVIYKGFSGPPRVRYGTYPIDIVGTPFVGPNLGSHGYHLTLAEKDGVAYTCRGGTVDIIHVRIAADWTAYLTATTYKHLMKGDPGFSYKLAVDRSRSYLRFTYPPNWNSLSQAQRSALAKDVSLTVGPYLAFTMTSWHEMITWFGFKCIGLPTEFPSAFSWEDSYSNLLGTIIATRALQDPKHPYNEAIKIALDEEMRKQGILSAARARQISGSVRDDWYTGSVVLLVDIKMRNFDIGIGDGYVTPTLIPHVPECPNPQPMSYPVPTLDALARYGFALSLEIEPHEWERHKYLQVVYGDKPGTRIHPETDFPIIMEYICQKAAAKWGPQYGAALEMPKLAMHTAKR
jgi:hypothetical protein